MRATRRTAAGESTTAGRGASHRRVGRPAGPGDRRAGVRPGGRTIQRTSGFDAKLERVLAAGARVIAREGYGQATMRMVAAEAAMSLAGLYHYFSSKEELLFLLQFHTFDSIVSALKEGLAAVVDPRERLRVVVENHLDHFLSRMDQLKVCVHEMASLSGEYYRQVQELRREYFRVALGVVEQIGSASGGSRRNARLATLYLFGMLNWIYMWYPGERGIPGRTLAEELVALFLEGYLPRGDMRNGRRKARKADV